MKKEKWIILISLVVMLAIGTLCVVIYKENVFDSLSQYQEVTILIEGEVNSPGEYSLFEGMRVNDAVVAAGGITEDGDPSSINLAKHLENGEKIIVLQKPLSPENRININTATQEELLALPGIGEVKANAIIEYREKVGSFSSAEELIKVKGIGEKTLEQIKDLLEF